MFSTSPGHTLQHYLVGLISPFMLEQMSPCLPTPWMMHIKVSLWYAPGILLPDATAFHAAHSDTAPASYFSGPLAFDCTQACLLQFHGNDGLGDAPNAVPTAASVTFSASPGKLFARNVFCKHITACLGNQCMPKVYLAVYLCLGSHDMLN